MRGCYRSLAAALLDIASLDRLLQIDTMELDHWYFLRPLEADPKTTHPLPLMVMIPEVVERSPWKMPARGT